MRLPAFRRSDFVQVLRRNDDDQGAEPVGQGITVERAQVRSWIRTRVQQQPPDDDAGERQAERVSSEESGRIRGACGSVSSHHLLKRTTRVNAFRASGIANAKVIAKKIRP